MARKSTKANHSSVNRTRSEDLDVGTGTSRVSASERMDRDIAGRRTIVGVFDNRDHAEMAIRDLKDAGFSGDQIGIAMRDRTAQGELVEDTGTHAAEGAVTGAVGGGILGGLTGLLIGIGALAIPGIGPVVAGGALATAFGTAAGTAVAGAGIGAAAGGIVGALVGMGVPEEEARYFESGFRSGGVLVSVNAENRAMEALNILEQHGADTGSGLGASQSNAGLSRTGSDVETSRTRSTRRGAADDDELMGDDVSGSRTY